MPATGLSSLPSVGARALAFVGIIVAGLSGAAIGWAIVRLQCTGDCTVPKSVGALTGTLLFAGGSAVIAVLALRALAEWKANQ
jgi:hypothetical protein